MLKTASLSLVAFLAFASPLFADDKPCFPVGVTIATAPAKETKRLEGDELAKFKAVVKDKMTTVSDPLPADADLVILFKINGDTTAFSTAKGGCTLGTGSLPNKLLDQLLGGDDGSI